MSIKNRIPVLFIGQGFPLNAIADNDYTHTHKKLVEELHCPKAVLCISVHWMSEGTWITHMEKPKTIHDFYGFSRPLFEVQYPAYGVPKIAEEIAALIKDPSINLNSEMWRLDHGSWPVLKHMWPKADVPVMQLSIYIK